MKTPLPSQTAASFRQQAERAFIEGDFTKAEQACRALLALEPSDTIAHYLLSNIATDSHRHRLAVEHALAAASKLAGHGIEHRCAVSLKLISVGEYSAAARILEALDLQNRSTATQLAGIARQFSILEEHQRSLECLETARRFSANSDRVHFLLGNASKFLGNIKAAADHYERCLHINPRFAYAHWALAYLGKRYNSASHVSRIRSLLATGRLNEDERTSLEYALFKELDTAGEYDQAWLALTRGSASKNRRVKYDPAEEAWIFDQLANGYQRLMAGSGASDSAIRPIFIVGMPRTGTTLLERILGNSEGLATCGELNDLRMQYKWCSDYFCTGFFDVPSVKRIASVDHAVLGQRYIEHVRWRIGDSVAFTDKNPGNFMMVGTIVSSLPQAKILHMSRKPIDSCFSNLKELFAGNSHPYSYSLENLASHHRNYKKLMARWEAMAPGRVMDVGYESLVSDPESISREVTDFCGLAYDQEQTRIETSARPVSTASSAQVREPIHSRNVDAWRHYSSHLSRLNNLLDWDAA